MTDHQLYLVTAASGLAYASCIMGALTYRSWRNDKKRLLKKALRRRQRDPYLRARGGA